jgi:aspartyl-tRNA(Asn)/glutamyl-tRNA(Gln) amidotransferase subunit A
MLNRRSFGLALSGVAVGGMAQTAGETAQLSLSEAAARLQSRQITSTTLVESCLARVEVYQPKLNAFITVLKEAALAQAREADAEIRAGKYRGPLHGVPIALKDNIDTAGIRTTAASAVFDNRIPSEDAEVVRRLKAAGAILLGKLNLHEFANGGTSVTSYFGPVRNPWNLARHPGGSSGGSAAAVSADLCFGALGTDTGGSIRTPSSYCSIVGFKPTYGLVSIRGIVPLVVSFDHCGPMTKTVEDAAIMLNVLAGYDRLDIASVEHAKEDYVALMKQPVKALRIGVPRAPYFDKLDADVAKVVEAAIAKVATLTAGVKEARLPSARGTSASPEMYAYHEEYFAQSKALYQIPVRRNLDSAKDAKAVNYIQAIWKLQLLRRTIDDAFTNQNVDLMVLPTRRRTPRTVVASIQREEIEKVRNPELENPADFNAFGIPALTLPCGFASDGMPIGLLIVGPRFSEGKVLALARAYEQATEWHKRRPELRGDTVVPPLAKTDDD